MASYMMLTWCPGHQRSETVSKLSVGPLEHYLWIKMFSAIILDVACSFVYQIFSPTTAVINPFWRYSTLHIFCKVWRFIRTPICIYPLASVCHTLLQNSRSSSPSSSRDVIYEFSKDNPLCSIHNFKFTLDQCCSRI